MIVFAAIASHGDPAFVEGSATNKAMHELGRRQQAAAPAATVVLTPHNVHVDGAFAVITRASLPDVWTNPWSSSRASIARGRPVGLLQYAR